MKIFFLLLLCSCAHTGSKRGPQEIKRFYSYTDVSGTFDLIREHKLVDKKLVTRTQLLSRQGGEQKVLEKSITVSQLGTIKENKKKILISRPYASDFTVWLEGKKYESKIRLNKPRQSLDLKIDSTDNTYQGPSQIVFPKGRQFCFFSQLPECLYHSLNLEKAKEKDSKGLAFYIIWDGHPFIQEQLSGISLKIFAPAMLKFEGEDKSILRYIVEVSGQSLLYHFSKSFDLVRMFWVAQGISMVPKGEEQNDVEE